MWHYALANNDIFFVGRHSSDICDYNRNYAWPGEGPGAGRSGVADGGGPEGTVKRATGWQLARKFPPPPLLHRAIMYLGQMHDCCLHMSRTYVFNADSNRLCWYFPSSKGIASSLNAKYIDPNHSNAFASEHLAEKWGFSAKLVPAARNNKVKFWKNMWWLAHMMAANWHRLNISVTFFTRETWANVAQVQA